MFGNWGLRTLEDYERKESIDDIKVSNADCVRSRLRGASIGSRLRSASSTPRVYRIGCRVTAACARG